MGGVGAGDGDEVQLAGHVGQRLRDDVVTESDHRAENQRSAPSVADGLYLVPRVVE